jgi:hypothetical protein
LNDDFYNALEEAVKELQPENKFSRAIEEFSGSPPNLFKIRQGHKASVKRVANKLKSSMSTNFHCTNTSESSSHACKSAQPSSSRSDTLKPDINYEAMIKKDLENFLKKADPLFSPTLELRESFTSDTKCSWTLNCCYCPVELTVSVYQSGGYPRTCIKSFKSHVTSHHEVQAENYKNYEVNFKSRDMTLELD